MRIIMRKKAYLRTLEAVIAMALSIVFIMMFIPSSAVTPKPEKKISLLSIAEQDPNFRNCAIAEDYGCLNATFCLYYPYFCTSHGYWFNASIDPNTFLKDLPAKDINIESVYIAGNDTYIMPRIVKLYYWDE